MKTDLDQQSLEGENALVTGASPDHIGRPLRTHWVGRARLGGVWPATLGSHKCAGAELCNYVIM